MTTRPSRKEPIHQILSAMPDSHIEEAADSGSNALVYQQPAFDLLFVDINQ